MNWRLSRYLSRSYRLKPRSFPLRNLFWCFEKRTDFSQSGLFRSLSLFFFFLLERTNEQTSKQIQIITQNISSSYRISRTVSVPPRALLWSTPAWSDSPLLTFRTILGGNFSPLPSVWTFGISGTATRAPLWDLRTLSTLLLLYSVFQLLFNYCCCLLVASVCYLSSNVFCVMGCHTRNWMKTLLLWLSNRKNFCQIGFLDRKNNSHRITRVTFFPPSFPVVVVILRT
jgi:hypothetical protein